MVAGTGRDTLGVRRHNLRSVLRHLHVHGATTRAELGRVTGLTRSAVGDLVAELTDRQLVAESDPDASGRAPGRPSLLVAPRDDAARVLAVDIRADSLRTASVGLGGTVSDLVEVPHDPVPDDPGRSIDQLAGLIVDQLAGLDPPPLAVGVAVPGIVRTSDGAVALIPSLGWRDVRLGAELRRRTGVGVPLVTGNESNLAALAEHLRGAGRGHDSLIYVFSGLGVGGGVIVDGELLLGGHPGYAGEVGHMVVDLNGPRCHCGGRGCWETLVGADALLRHAGIAAGTPAERRAAVTALLAAAEEHDPTAVAALDTLLPPIGAGLATLLSLFAPDRIVLAGLFAPLLRDGGADLRAAIARHRPALSDDLVELVPDQLGPDAPLLGAAEAAIEAFLDSVTAAGRGRLVGSG